MKVIPGADGWRDGYEYTAGGQTVRIAGEVVPGIAAHPAPALLHPLNDHYGLSPIEAAATAIDIHNDGGALEQGAARQLGETLRRARLRRRRSDDGRANSSA